MAGAPSEPFNHLSNLAMLLSLGNKAANVANPTPELEFVPGISLDGEDGFKWHDAPDHAWVYEIQRGEPVEIRLSGGYFVVTVGEQPANAYPAVSEEDLPE
jgi:hypothetical protein